MLIKCLPRQERVNYFSVADFLLTRLLFFAKKNQLLFQRAFQRGNT